MLQLLLLHSVLSTANVCTFYACDSLSTSFAHEFDGTG